MELPAYMKRGKKIEVTAKSHVEKEPRIIHQKSSGLTLVLVYGKSIVSEEFTEHLPKKIPSEEESTETLLTNYDWNKKRN